MAPSDPRAAFGEKVARVNTRNPPAAGSVFLDTGDALVDQYFDFNATVLGPPGLRLVRGRWSVFTHRPRRNDMAYRHATLLHQVSDHGFGAVLAQFRVHLSAAGRVGIACNLDDVSSKTKGGLRQLLEFC